MNDYFRLLWVDDNLDNDLAEKRMAVSMQDDIEASFAGNATDAFYLLRDHPFDVVILDLRLPAGPHNMWDDFLAKHERKFGHALLSMVHENPGNLFGHLSGTCFGVFTIELREENLALFLPPIGLPEANFMMKTHAFYENDFLDFIRQVRRRL